MENNYYEVQISYSKKNYDEIYNSLYLHGIENILEEEGVLKIYFDESDLVRLNLLKEYLTGSEIIPQRDFVIEKFEQKNWNNEWEKSIEPVYIRDKIIVYPSWKKNELNNAEDKILIEIDPKMSFGTGHNETTQLVLEMMSDNIKGDEEKLLDFGCGTGILTIAGIKLGVGQAVAIDTDDDSIQNAEEYFDRNSVHHKIKLLKTDISELKDDSFDIICANIISSVIIENIEHISEKINHHGKLFISGVLLSEDQELLEYLTQHEFEVIDIASKSEWIGIYAIKS